MSFRDANLKHRALVVFAVCLDIAVAVISALIFAMCAFATFFMGAADPAAFVMVLALGGMALAALLNVRVLRPMIRSLDENGQN